MKFKQLIEHLKHNQLIGIRQYLITNPPWLTGAAAGIMSVAMLQLGMWKPLEYLGYKTLFQIRESGVLPNPGWDDRIAVIAIEPQSLQEYGQFPWPRNRYAELLSALKKSPPTAVGFDILFLDPSPKDQMLAGAIATNGKVVLPRTTKEQPVASLKAAAAGVGHIMHEPNSDGVSRDSKIFLNSIPNLGLAMTQRYNAANPQNPVLLPQPHNMQEQTVWVNWPGKTENLRTYAFVDVAEGRIPANALADKLVLVGIVATGFDQISTPLNKTTAGVYLYAALVDNLLNQRLLKRLPVLLEIFLLLGIGPLTTSVLCNRGVKARIAIALGLPVIWVTAAAVLFGCYFWWLPVAAPIGTLILSGTALQLREQYEKQQLMRLFEKHVAPETAQLIWERKAEIFEQGELEPQELTATVLFMDIRSFTSISEKMRPRDLLTWLNNYLEAMTNCIMDHGGVVDKYIGDAIMAVFGVPFCHTEYPEIQQDALNAVAACIAMHEKLHKLNEQLRIDRKPLIKFGIGLHTGQLVAGSVGGSRRLNYSVIGDAVNVAARLEAMNKEIVSDSPFNLLVTGRTFAYVRDRYEGQKVGAIQLRGKKEETVVYAILGEKH
ncbi:MAG: adenylate/guanylate cyclase domain-containing protein [Microcoleus sp. PH2017_10_PVI_O_A]|uniref:CHASE2 domain-containing protein n=1 Tax=unclassified Microcoleus TaxID=2642155 RepID=UPI001DF58B85|nr:MULTISPECIES: adenylate/guanylate cyclase domain-containing protein [unclassified Microcoleus]TAE79539.1 MAG: adenylate/guanylate cyclase domain-containing protein [Oscillatoriales cyanobacterium]MCC3408220.1 adenylate/guanylate cyclase domain-containing protein [Microcoleus sp. PH2017_10_PVI_O_A]MCC3462290.1 adenylate/guanylate cyclase domain-containing protein [Microcoleus sp. PH2017_11_PCY_U_A]MCC3480765.1 adenylate/guanylate cyclase domain-containing protein [Microcoleus sp. PH2017_12_PC